MHKILDFELFEIFLVKVAEWFRDGLFKFHKDGQNMDFQQEIFRIFSSKIKAFSDINLFFKKIQIIIPTNSIQFLTPIENSSTP